MSLKNSGSTLLKPPDSATYASLFPQRQMPGASGLALTDTSLATVGAVVTGSPASSISGAIGWAAVTGGTVVTSTFSYRGGFAIVTTSPTGFAQIVEPVTGTVLSYAVEFDYYGAKFEFRYLGSGNLGSRVMVDGKYVEAAYVADTTQDVSVHQRPVTFGSAGWRRIRIEMTQAAWAGLYTGATDTVQPVPVNTDRLLVIGDSYVAGAGATQNAMSNYTAKLVRMLGIKDCFAYGVSGTGILATGGGLKYLDRAAAWGAVNPVAVAIHGSINDLSADANSAVRAAANVATGAALTPLLAAIKANCPTAKYIYMTGPCFVATPSTSQLALDTALSAAASALGLPYFSLMQPVPIIKGTGSPSFLVGDGNADVLASGTVGGHPSEAGHEAIARGIYSRLAPARPAA